MRSFEVARAVPDLVRQGVIPPANAARCLAAARGDLVSVRAELRALAGLGVTLLTAGLGLLLRQNLDALGPVAIAVLLAMAAVGAGWATSRRAPSFSWQRPAEGDWIVDALALLTAALVAADLAWLEVQFTPLGAEWPYHLLFVALVTGALAVRFDSNPTWSLALSSFAAWRGVALVPSARGLERVLLDRGFELRLQLLICAVVFFVVGYACRRFDRKAHFEPTTTLVAVLVASVALALGLGEGSSWPAWGLALIGFGSVAAAWAFRRRRLALFAVAAFAAYLGVTRFLFVSQSLGLGCFWLAMSAVGGMALLVVLHRRFRAEEPE